MSPYSGDMYIGVIVNNMSIKINTCLSVSHGHGTIFGTLSVKKNFILNSLCYGSKPNIL